MQGDLIVMIKTWGGQEEEAQGIPFCTQKLTKQ